MDYFEVSILILLQAKEMLRTKIQKIIYFASQLGITKDTFAPHYYGPYSKEIAETMESLVSSGFIREDVVPFQEGIGYLYSLTSDGKLVAHEVTKKYSAGECAKLSEIVDACKDAPPLLLSLAAKVHFILKQKRIPMTLEQIREHAKGLHWQISSEQINIACRLLEKLGFVEREVNTS
jgi:hypothetical protein